MSVHKPYLSDNDFVKSVEVSTNQVWLITLYFNMSPLFYAVGASGIFKIRCKITTIFWIVQINMEKSGGNMLENIKFAGKQAITSPRKGQKRR